MSAYRFVTLTCDGCGEIWDEGYETRTVNARKRAARRGWRVVGKGRDARDYCTSACVDRDESRERAR